MTARWSSVRERYFSLVAPDVRPHIGLHVARYRGAHDREGRGWITWDGVEVASFETIPYLVRRHNIETRRREAELADNAEALETAARAGGTFPLWDFTDAVAAYPDLSIEEAITSTDPIIRALALFDRRVGKRRLATLSLRSDEPEFVRRLYDLRCRTEGLSATPETPA